MSHPDKQQSKAPNIKFRLSKLLPNRKFRKVSLLLIGVGLFGFFVYLLYDAWRVQLGNPVTCTLAYSDLKSPHNTGYVEFALTEQHAVEPSFKGEVFIRILNADPVPSDHLLLTISGSRGYGNSESYFVRNYDSHFRNLDITGNREISLVSTERSHWYFPFDSARFDFEITLEPDSNIQLIRIVDRVPGFVTDCNEAHSVSEGLGKHHINFRLRRSPLIVLTAVTLVGASAVFLILLVSLVRPENLATSVASFFFLIMVHSRHPFFADEDIPHTSGLRNSYSLCVIACATRFSDAAFESART